MWRFWSSHIQPLLDAAQAKRVMEIGADDGYNTRRILEWCATSGAVLDVVDPEPTYRLKIGLEENPPELYVYHRLPSLDAIPVAEAPDVALIDGDHNWHTVYRECQLLFEGALRRGVPAPIILFHEAAWPYARRDMYYVPDRIHQEFRHAYAYRGMKPGESELSDEGLNPQLANAEHEGGPRNGVLTAVENFVAEWPGEITLRTLPWFNGLGIVIPAARATPQVNALVDSFYSSDSLLASCVELEKWNAMLLIELQKSRINFDRRTAALERARDLLSDRRARIEQLEAELAALKAGKS